VRAQGDLGEASSRYRSRDARSSLASPTASHPVAAGHTRDGWSRSSVAPNMWVGKIHAEELAVGAAVLRLPIGPAIARRPNRPALADHPPGERISKMHRDVLFLVSAHLTKNGRSVAGSARASPTNCDATSAIKNVKRAREKPRISIVSDGAARGHASTNAVVEFTNPRTRARGAVPPPPSLPLHAPLY
jgi:hypothetical protein